MLYRLIILNGVRKGHQWNVPEGPFYIGSDPSCDLCLADSEAAARHAIVEPDGDALRIRDLGSMHGLLVNQQETREARLRHGDICEIGRTRLMVEARVRAEVDSPLPPPRRRRTVAIVALLALAALAGLAALGPIRVRRSEKSLSKAPPPAPPAESIAPDSPAESVPGPAGEPVRTPTADALPDLPLADGEAEVEAPGPVISPGPANPPEAASSVVTDSLVSVPSLAESAPWGLEDVDSVVRRKLLAEARAALTAREFEQAQRVLNRLLALAPEEEEALALQAELWEKRGMIKRAIRVWARLADQDHSLLRERADGERRRLEDLDRQLAASAPPVRLAEVRQVRLPGQSEEEEIRVISIHLERDATVETPLDPDAILVQATFYERLAPSDQIVPVARSAPRSLRVEGPWPNQGPLILSTVYRSEASAGTTPRGRFYGYHVRLLAYDRPVAEYAQPRELLLSSRAQVTLTAQDAQP